MTTNPYLTPADLFAAYALMKGTEDALPETKAYYEKRWRFIAGLFGIDHRAPKRMHDDWSAGARLLEGLTRERNKLEYCELLPNHVSRLNGQIDEALYDQHKDALASKVEALREHYDLMGGEVLVKLFSEIEGVRVLRSRLQELGLPSHPPDPDGEMRAYKESRKEQREDPKVPLRSQKFEDDVTFERLFSLKVSEEVEERGRESLRQDVELIRQKAVDLGLAPVESVDAFISDMSAKDFLKLSKGFPKVSRVDFQLPEPPKPDAPSGVMETIRSFFSRKKSTPPPSLEIPEEEPSARDPIWEQLERLRKENPGLFREYSEAHIRHVITQCQIGVMEHYE
jgi:hypothetical protein